MASCVALLVIGLPRAAGTHTNVFFAAADDAVSIRLGLFRYVCVCVAVCGEDPATVDGTVSVTVET